MTAINGSLEVLPRIGSKGVYTLRTPFDQQIKAQVEYTCIDISLLSALEAQDVDAYTTIYQENGLSQTQYNEDVSNGRCVITLQSSSGVLVKVPSSFIVGTPDASGVRYSVYMLGVNLGALPDGQDFSVLTSGVKEIVNSYTGQDSEVQMISVEPAYLIQSELHEQITAARQLRLAQTQSVTLQNQALKLENDSLRQQIQTLLDYIRDNT